MPSKGAPSWFGTKYADNFGPVCPQKFPDPKLMAPQRREQYLKLKHYLHNQSEDCLYLNIYAPYQEKSSSTRKYPVMVYIHGESYEWNSGNPYDGSILAAYGNVIVVTLNFRLGILGFLKAGTEEHSKSNFGLIDQIAALLWVRANIAAFGGDPNAVTLFGHGTGAACISLLMLSPMVLQEGNKMLFQRAILMGGTALSDWALAGNPREVTYQVAQGLNCQIQDDIASCLRRKRLEEIMAASNVDTGAYRTKFGPVVDSVIVPNNPKKSMTTYSDIFRRFELMYGVTEQESIHLLGPVALTHGMLEKERDQELRKYLRWRCEMKPELCVTRTLAEYTESEFTLDDEKLGGFTGHEPDRASLARDALLDILSDARSVAPIVQTAKYHAAVNLQSYFYVFTHKTQAKEFLRNKSFHGEELPYVFGVPLDGPKFHFTDQYSEKERLLSEIIMTYFTNFAYTGNPNVPRKNEFYTLSLIDWLKYEVDWPEFDLKQERYLQLGIPPYVSQRYRHKETHYWNDIFPSLSNNYTIKPIVLATSRNSNSFLSILPKGKPPYILDHPARKTTMTTLTKTTTTTTTPYKPNLPKNIFGTVKLTATTTLDKSVNNLQDYGTVINSPPEKGNVTLNILSVFGLLFLIANLFLFLGLYYKCYKIKKSRSLSNQNSTTNNSSQVEKNQKSDEESLIGDCNLIRMIRNSSSKNDSAYEAVKTNQTTNIKRQMSNSTIDAHTKVRDWITQEIVHKYSPKFLRHNNKRNDELKPVNDFYDGNSPTRPVSPCTDIKKKCCSKPEKVSVGIDATPSGRGPSVLQQLPIELIKLDKNVMLRRSSTFEDFTKSELPKIEMRKSLDDLEPTVIKIGHCHSKSEPVQDLYATTNLRKNKRLKTFDPDSDVNVTCREDNIQVTPLTPAESLMTIKRRNFPKVLPDYPNRDALKRRSMPVASMFSTIPELGNVGKSDKIQKCPPIPPPRGTSTLTRRTAAATTITTTTTTTTTSLTTSITSNHYNTPICQSTPMLAKDPPTTPEPEVACNNLFVGPLIPKSNPDYSKMRSGGNQMAADDAKITKIISNDSNGIEENSDGKLKRKSQIPTLIRSQKESSSSESTPSSEESDTGTVVKRV